MNYAQINLRYSKFFGIVPLLSFHAIATVTLKSLFGTTNLKIGIHLRLNRMNHLMIHEEFPKVITPIYTFKKENAKIVSYLETREVEQCFEYE